MTEQAAATETELELGSLSDEEIMSMDPASRKLDISASEPSNDSDEAQSTVDTTDEDNESEDADGAAAEYQSPGPDVDSVDSTSADEDDEPGTDEQTGEPENTDSTDDQSESTDSDDSTTTEESSSDIDYKAAYERVMAPFKAAGRTIKPNSLDDVTRLMQMGVDYTRKMEQMKPFQRVLQTLKQNDLIDIDAVNLMIDLQKGNPEAIKKFLKDNKVDPIELDLEDDTEYTPNDHTVGDKEVAIQEVLDEIRDRETFNRTATVITKEWDTASQNVLQDTPAVIKIISDHMEMGIYDQIAERVANERTFGRLQGLSDLEAYKAVGDAIHKAGGFNPPSQNETSSTGQTDQGHSQDLNGSDGSESRKNRKRAASPTKGAASTRKKAPNFFGKDLSDEEILNMEPPS